MPAIPYTDTAVSDGVWDGPANEAKIANDAGAATLRKMYTWVEAGANPDAKASYKLPHHFVSNGTPSAASVAGVRAALARVGQGPTQIPAADVGAVRTHLQKHLDKYNAAQKSSGLEVDDQDDFVRSRITMLDADALRVIEVEGRTWAIRSETLEALAAYQGATASPALAAMAEEFAATTAATPAQVVGGTAVIPLKGVLMPQSGLLAMLLGAGDGLARFRSRLADAASNRDVGQIVLNVDSPGGLVDHIPETAAEIRQANRTKPVVAVANTLAASAAYWLASQAGQLVVTPSGEAGSIGVYQVHQDHSQRYADAGVRHTIIKAGRFKVEGNPYQPLSEEAHAAAQQAVDDHYQMFTRDVAKGRDVSVSDVREGFGEGRTLTARRAVEAGLADRVDTLEGTLASLTRGDGSGSSRRSEDSPLAAMSAEERGRWLDVALAGSAA